MILYILGIISVLIIGSLWLYAKELEHIEEMEGYSYYPNDTSSDKKG